MVVWRLDDLSLWWEGGGVVAVEVGVVVRLAA
jgi:hypothetical protein